MTETEFGYDVFLSHNGKDKPAVEHLGRLLRDQYNQKVWLDKWNLVPGEPWQEGLEDALDDCQTFAVFLGPSGIGPWENEEIRSAIEERVQDKNRRVIPVLLPGASDNKDLKLPRFLRRATWVDFRSGLDDEEALYRLYCGITGQAPGDRGSSVAPKHPSLADWYLAHPYPMPPNFTGRAAEQKVLDEWLADNKDRLFILRALGGFGKSALAWQWINTHVNSAEWRKLVWWSFYEGDASFEHFIEETLKYLHIEVPQGGRPEVDALLDAMKGQKILLIMDGFERALRAYSSMNAAYQGDEAGEFPSPASGRGDRGEDLDCVNLNAEIFLQNVCSLPNIKSKILMTTRLTPRTVKPRGEFMLGCREVELTSMQPADAVEFFHKQKIKGTHAEVEAACAPYGYHPLSLRLLAGRILKDFENPADIVVAQKLRIDGDMVQQKHHVLEVSYDSLPEHEQKLLSTIACFRSPVELKTLEAIADDVVGTRYIVSLQDDLHDIVARGLLHFDDKNKKFDLHPIVRRYAYEYLSTLSRTAAHKRLVDYFEAIADSRNIEKLEDLNPVIELFHHVSQAGDKISAVRLYSDRIRRGLYFQLGEYQIIIELLQSLFKEEESNLPELEEAIAWTLNELGKAYGMNGQPAQALDVLKKSLEIHKKLKHKEDEAKVLSNLANRYLDLGKLEESITTLRLGADLCGEVLLEAIIHRQLGRVMSYCGMWNDALIEFRKSQIILNAIRAIQLKSALLSYRAHYEILFKRDLSSLQSSASSPIDFALKSLEIDNEISELRHPYVRDIIRTHWTLGAAYLAQNKLEGVEIHLLQALTSCRRINNVEIEGRILLDLARLRYEQKNYTEAISLANEALLITERCGYVLQGADVNLFLAQYALKQEKDKAKAKQYAEEAKKLATCDGPPYYYKVAYEEAERFLEQLNENV